MGDLDAICWDEMDEIHGGTEQFVGFHDWDRLDRQPMGYSEFMMFSWDLQATSYDDWVSENEVYPQLAFGKRKKHHDDSPVDWFPY